MNTSNAEPGVSTLPIINGELGLETSIICKPPFSPSAINA